MKIKNVAKYDNSNHITCYKIMSNYSLDCTKMLNCNGSCGNECKEFFSKFIHEACWYINFHAKLKSGYELVKRYN